MGLQVLGEGIELGRIDLTVRTIQPNVPSIASYWLICRSYRLVRSDCHRICNRNRWRSSATLLGQETSASRCTSSWSHPGRLATAATGPAITCLLIESKIQEFHWFLLLVSATSYLEYSESSPPTKVLAASTFSVPMILRSAMVASTSYCWLSGMPVVAFSTLRVLVTVPSPLIP